MGDRKQRPKIDLKNTITNIESSGERCLAIDIMPVNVAPVRLIQTPALTGPGNRSKVREKEETKFIEFFLLFNREKLDYQKLLFLSKG